MKSDAVHRLIGILISKPADCLEGVTCYYCIRCLQRSKRAKIGYLLLVHCKSEEGDAAIVNRRDCLGTRMRNGFKMVVDNTASHVFICAWCIYICELIILKDHTANILRRMRMKLMLNVPVAPFFLYFEDFPTLKIGVFYIRILMVLLYEKLNLAMCTAKQ